MRKTIKRQVKIETTTKNRPRHASNICFKGQNKHTGNMETYRDTCGKSA